MSTTGCPTDSAQRLGGVRKLDRRVDMLVRLVLDPLDDRPSTGPQRCRVDAAVRPVMGSPQAITGRTTPGETSGHFIARRRSDASKRREDAVRVSSLGPLPCCGYSRPPVVAVPPLAATRTMLLLAVPAYTPDVEFAGFRIVILRPRPIGHRACCRLRKLGRTASPRSSTRCGHVVRACVRPTWCTPSRTLPGGRCRG